MENRQYLYKPIDTELTFIIMNLVRLIILVCITFMIMCPAVFPELLLYVLFSIPTTIYVFVMSWILNILLDHQIYLLKNFVLSL